MIVFLILKTPNLKILALRQKFLKFLLFVLIQNSHIENYIFIEKFFFRTTSLKENIKPYSNLILNFFRAFLTKHHIIFNF